jgi:hypothetical protein
MRDWSAGLTCEPGASEHAGVYSRLRPVNWSYSALHQSVAAGSARDGALCPPLLVDIRTNAPSYDRAASSMARGGLPNTATAGAAAVEQRGRGGKIRSWEGTRDRGSAGKTEGGFPGARIRRSVRHAANLADGSLQPMCLRDELCLGEEEDLSSARCEHGEQSASGLPGDRSAR